MSSVWCERCRKRCSVRHTHPLEPGRVAITGRTAIFVCARCLGVLRGTLADRSLFQRSADEAPATQLDLWGPK
jgi:hypothetical protein